MGIVSKSAIVNPVSTRENNILNKKIYDGWGLRVGIMSYPERAQSLGLEELNVLIPEETLRDRKYLESFEGCPIVLQHQDVNDNNHNLVRRGTVLTATPKREGTWVSCVIDDKECNDKIEEGWGLSTLFYVKPVFQEGVYKGRKYQAVITNSIQVTHLAVVKRPRDPGCSFYNVRGDGWENAIMFMNSVSLSESSASRVKNPNECFFSLSLALGLDTKHSELN